MKRSTRPLTLGVTTALAVGAVATGAAAQDATSIGVSAAANAGSRQFFVEDLTGQALTALDLGTRGQGELFQTRVRDVDYASPQASFTASAEMTHLYRKAGEAIDYTTRVSSADLRVDFAATPTDVAGVSLNALPQIRITGLLPKCSQLTTLLPTGSALLGTGSLLGGALGSLGLSNAAAPLCSALGGATATSPLSVDQADGVVVTLQQQVVDVVDGTAASLPVSLTGPAGDQAAVEPGAFTDPSFLGDGAGDPGKSTTPATTRKVLAGSPSSALDLDGLVSGAIDGLPLFPAVPGGTGALTSVSNVVAALQGSSDAAVAKVGNTLAGLSAADQTGVLSGLTSAVPGNPVATLVDTLLDRVSGTYRSFPRLSANLSGAPAGSYTGTLTITFVQE